MAENPGEDRKQAWVRRTVSHDLRGPIAVVLGQCELFEAGLRGPLSEKQQASVEAIRRQTEKLEAMVEQLRGVLFEGREPPV